MNKKVSDYIKKQKSPEKEIFQKLRSLILKTLPGVKEEIRWGVPVFGDGRFYIGALKNHINLGFAVKGLTKEEAALFEGSGKTMRHIKICTLRDIDKKRIARLLKMVAKKSKCEEGC